MNRDRQTPLLFSPEEFAVRSSNWIQQADQAMIRAAARAKAVAASTNTSIHIMKDGEIVEILPAKNDQSSPPFKRPV